MRKRARTVLCGGRSAMVVPTVTTNLRCSIMPCEIMTLNVGTQLGSHEITGLLGKGGMDI